MSKRYDKNQPIVVALQLELSNTKAKYSNKINDIDADFLGDLQEKYGDAAIVELLAGFHLGSVLTQQYAKFPVQLHTNSEQIGVTLYGAASAVAGLSGEDKTGRTSVFDTNNFAANPVKSPLKRAEDDLEQALGELETLLKFSSNVVN